jgi:dGTPase
MSKRTTARSRYIFSLISPNYLEQAYEGGGSDGVLPLRYRELRLLTDMVSGMTDTFALKFWQDISALPNASRT